MVGLAHCGQLIVAGISCKPELPVSLISCDASNAAPTANGLSNKLNCQIFCVRRAAAELSKMIITVNSVSGLSREQLVV